MAREDEDNGFAEWGGYMEAKKTKLEEQFAAASEMFCKSKLFAGISIIVNGLTNPSADELKRIMMQHGGTFHHYQRPHTTYTIASNLPDVKVRNMDTSKIISPQWVVDCVKEERILDYTRYLLYTNQKTTQPRINFSKGNSKQNELQQSRISNELNGIQEKLQVLKAQMLDLALPAAPSNANITLPATHSEQKLVNISETNVKTNVALTAVDPKFLSEFYNNSRLHHIATLGAGFKQYVSELRAQHISTDGFPARKQLKSLLLANGTALTNCKISACVMHIDMDCFFVSVGLRNHPELRGMPIAVTHSKGGTAATDVPVHPQADRQAEKELFAQRFHHDLHDEVRTDKVRQGFEAKMSLSEIASCSYEARAKGIRNGMFVGQAMKLCPDLKTIAYDFEGYREVAFTLYDTLAQYTLNIEAVSCDEMFVELSEVLNELQVAPMDFVSAIRKEVRSKTGCPCSAGVGANKLQARMATKRAKPDGQYMLDAADVMAYMAPIAIGDLPGVGNQTAHTLKQAQLLTCGDLQQVSLAKIQMLVGKKFGDTLHQYCRGIDNRALAYEQVRKSVSAEVNYGIRFKEYTECETFLRQLCVEVHTRLMDIKRRTKCITLKLMVRAKDAPVETSKFMGHGVCDNITKATTLTEFTNDVEKITQTILNTMKALNLPPNELRGIGIHLSKLDEPNEAGKEKKENAIKNMFSKVVEKQKDKQLNGQQQASTEIREAPATHSEIASKVEQKPKTSPKRSKRVGRPSKFMSPPKNQGNVLSFFQNAPMANKKPRLMMDVGFVDEPEFDPEVLAALPEDIRLEVLRESAKHKRANANLQASKSEKSPLKEVVIPNEISKPLNEHSPLKESDFLPSTSKAAEEKRHQKEVLKGNSTQDNMGLQPDPEFMDALPPNLRVEVEMGMLQEYENPLNLNDFLEPISTAEVDAATALTMLSSGSKPTPNVFLNENSIMLLRSWVTDCTLPESVDIDMVTNSACEAVLLDELDKLYDGMCYLARLINAQRDAQEHCPWHLAYRIIEDAIQMQMRSLYGKTLRLPEHMACQFC